MGSQGRLVGENLLPRPHNTDHNLDKARGCRTHTYPSHRPPRRRREWSSSRCGGQDGSVDGTHVLRRPQHRDNLVGPSCDGTPSFVSASASASASAPASAYSLSGILYALCNPERARQQAADRSAIRPPPVRTTCSSYSQCPSSTEYPSLCSSSSHSQCPSSPEYPSICSTSSHCQCATSSQCASDV